MNNVALVDIHGNDTGEMDKIAVHEQGLLHRAFSIFIFNDNDELLLQRRSDSKYHSAGLWSNTCASHPLPGEQVIESAHNRLQEEMGIDCKLNEIFCLTYKASMGRGLIEHEYDHILMGRANSAPRINTEEAQEWKWAPISSLCEDILRFPDQYTQSFKLIIKIRVTRLFESLK